MEPHVETAKTAIEGHPQATELARVVHTAVVSAADERRRRFGDGLDELLSEAGMSAGDAQVGEHDVAAMLRGDAAPSPQGRAIVAGLMARAVQATPPSDATASDRLAEQLAWLAAGTWFDALGAVTGALEGDARGRWMASLTGLVRGAAEGGAASGRGPALAAATALVVAEAPVSNLGESIDDPLLAAALRRGGPPASANDGAAMELGDGTSLEGELVPAPLGPVGLILQTFSGILVLRYLGRMLGGLLALKRPTTVKVAANGVTLRTKLAMLGKTLREREVLIPRDNLAQASREVRYRGLPLYVGIIALCVGTYVGVSIFTDGVRAGSPSLLAVGAGIVALGALLDLVFSTLVPAGRGRHRVVFVPRRGRALALSTADPRAADRALRELR